MLKILIINGHPDADPDRFCAALCAAYRDGAVRAGHEVRTLTLGKMTLPLIKSRTDFENERPPPVIEAAQESIRWCDHLVLVHPLWLGGAPALVKAFLEQAFRYGFAVPKPGGKGMKGLLAGRSARLIVTMGMPAAIQRLVFGAFGIRATERGILRLAGFRPVRHTLVGNIEVIDQTRRQGWLQKVGELGRRGR